MAGDSELPEPLPFPSSICHGCQHSRYIVNRRGSVFMKCQAQAVKYLPQPVLRCRFFTEAPEEAE